MKIVKDQIKIEDLKEICKNGSFEEVVKAVVDIEKEIMAVDAEVHAELMELFITEKNSESKNLWGINLVPEKDGEDFIVFDSLINLKPGFGNRTRGIESEVIRKKIVDIVNKLVIRFVPK